MDIRNLNRTFFEPLLKGFAYHCQKACSYLNTYIANCELFYISIKVNRVKYLYMLYI